ncbi:MAG: LysR family transcriptional regulator [Flavobacteriales bacterium]|nr:LysR family transcriptional regulator [Flavobacteriales bacterium]
MNYTIQQLNYLIALDVHKNFSKAAEHCFVSQPTLSMQIKKLENDLGVVIIDRSRQPLVFTELGIRIVEQARSSMDELKVIDDIISESKGEVAGSLSVGIIPTLAPYLIPLFLGDFLRRYPKVELSITEYKTEVILDKLQHENLDVGILSTPLNSSGIKETPLFYEKMLLYANASIAKKLGNRVSIDQILEDKLWILSEGNCFRNQTFNLCSLDQTEFRSLDVNYESGSIETLMRLVEKEGGSTIIPELALDALSEDRLDCVKFISDKNPVREISTVTRRSGLKASLINALRSEIMIALPKGLMENEENKTVVVI